MNFNKTNSGAPGGKAGCQCCWRCRKNGFSLVELMVVVAILSILALISVPNLHEAQIRAQVSAVKNNMRVFATNLELLNVDTNHYPLAGRWRWMLLSKDPVWQSAGNSPTDRFSKAYESMYGRFDDVFEYKAMQKLRKLDENWVGYENGKYLFHGFGFFSPPMMITALNGSCSWENGRLDVWEEIERLAGPWMLYSSGPDLYQNSPKWIATEDSQAESQYGGNCRENQFVEYDPTNGTVSFGDIYRTQKNPAGLGLSPGLARLQIPD